MVSSICFWRLYMESTAISIVFISQLTVDADFHIFHANVIPPYPRKPQRHLFQRKAELSHTLPIRREGE